MHIGLRNILTCNWKLLLSVIILSYTNSMNGQQDLWVGINSKSPALAIQFNPAQYSWDENQYFSANVFSFSTNYGNQFGYFKEMNIFRLLTHLDQINAPTLSSENGNIYDPDNPNIKYGPYDFHLLKSESKRDGFYSSAQVRGPGFIFRLKNDYAIGLITGIRAYTGMQGVDESINYYNYLMYIGGDKISIRPMSAKALSYLYAGLHISKNWTINSRTHFGIGSNIKYLGGIAAGYLTSKETINSYRFIKTDQQTIDNGSFEFHYSHNDLEDWKTGKLVRGSGIGFDLGFSWSQTFTSPTWQKINFGAALVNWGVIKFGNDLRKGSFKINDTTDIRYGLFRDDQNADELLASAKEIVNSKTANQFVSNRGGTVKEFPDLNLDLQIQLRDYASLSIYNSIPLNRESPEVYYFAISPGFNYGKFALSVPLSYDRLAQYRLGMSIHYDFITIATDDLRTLFNRQRLQSASVFFATNFKLYQSKAQLALMRRKKF